MVSLRPQEMPVEEAKCVWCAEYLKQLKLMPATDQEPWHIHAEGMCPGRILWGPEKTRDTVSSAEAAA